VKILHPYRSLAVVLAAVIFLAGSIEAAPLDNFQKLGPDSKTQPNVPRSTLTPRAQLPSEA